METNLKSKQMNLKRVSIMGLLSAIIALSVITVPIHVFAQTDNSNVNNNSDVQQSGNQSGLGDNAMYSEKNCGVDSGNDKETNDDMNGDKDKETNDDVPCNGGL